MPMTPLGQQPGAGPGHFASQPPGTVPNCVQCVCINYVLCLHPPVLFLLIGSLGNLGSAVLSATANHTNKIDPIMQAYLGMQYSGMFLFTDIHCLTLCAK